MKFDVDVKAFFSFEVEANSAAEAKEQAEAFIESAMEASEAFIDGYNETTTGPKIVSRVVSPAIDGIDIEEIG